MHYSWRKEESAKWNEEKNLLSVPKVSLLRCIRKLTVGFNVFVTRTWGGNGFGYESKYWVVNTGTKEVYYVGYCNSRTESTNLKEIVKRCGEARSSGK